ncbi:acyl-CoA dehydrogenase family protein [Endozoicomonas numazuensis]|uniref:Acyl-CoA dehydrogenase n=1 Tax=Endozoicomonas numazuensis TaxID=1137799 RepID=A0A081NMT4_9GAMM|nr:acyl-CoA dehydrogenase family protein [Endozoicomonas numazuensis]KEQ19757.1 acyl-CoA dehydrogenase [Endozoicomonas numazuensis]
MYIENTAEQKELRRELREYFSKLITPEVKEACHGNESGDTYMSVIRQMGEDGWLALGWPKEYGGQGRSTSEQLIFFEEAELAGAPIPFVTLNTVGPALMDHGSEEHKKEFLPKIAKGEVHFAIGYTEPGAGTDLASLNTSAIKDGDDYIINGTKVFTSSAEGADYIWLAARTDKESKHGGITLFMVDTKLPGFSVAPIYTMGDVRTNMTYYQDVRVPASMIVGELNGGWKLITSQLNHERVGLAAIGINAIGNYQKVLDWAREEQPNGQRVIDEPWVQSALAEAYTLLEAMKVKNARMAWELERNELNPAFASGIKVYSTECVIQVYRLLLDVVGPAGLVKRNSSAAMIQGELEEEYRKCQINTFGGGVNEVQRELVAMFGLGMRRAAR